MKPDPRDFGIDVEDVRKKRDKLVELMREAREANVTVIARVHVDENWTEPITLQDAELLLEMFDLVLLAP